MQSGDLMGAHAQPLGVEIPQGAIERVARRARRQKALQRGSVGAVLDRRASRFDGGANAFDAFAVAGVGRTLASAAMVALGDFRDDDHGLRLGAARDDKRAVNGEGFDGNLE